MKPIGPIIKRYIEEKGLRKGEVAKRVGITYNYLSTIFQKDTLDAAMLERLCIAIGLNPSMFFEVPDGGEIVHYSDIHARTQIGSAAVNINHNDDNMNKLLKEKDKLIEEKERTIRILMRQVGIDDGTDTRQTL